MQPGQIIEVLKGVFGLSTSPKLWWMKLSHDLLELEVHHQDQKLRFTQNEIDPCIFAIIKDDKTLALLLTHVDDIMLMSDQYLLPKL